MAKEKKVEQITDMEVDFAQWYTDICRKGRTGRVCVRQGLYDPASLWLRDLGKHPAYHGRGVQEDRP